MSLERAEALAFKGRLRAARSALAPPEASRPVAGGTWLRAYLAAAAGEFTGAERLARGVLSRRADPATRARAAVTLGSVLRQTGRHAEAREVERRALRTAPGSEHRAHLLIGIAADAVGLGDLRAVDRSLARVSVPPGCWRASIRLQWVRCERELLAGRPRAAAAHARRALAISVRRDARRHEAKSLLFIGASLTDVAASGRAPDRAATEAGRALRKARTVASRIGARPIAEVAGALLGRSVAHR